MTEKTNKSMKNDFVIKGKKLKLQQTLFSRAPKSLWRMTEVTELNNASSLEGNI